MVSKKNIIIISWSVVGAALVGIILMILVFVFALSILEEPFSLADIKKLHSEFNILYITRLIPIFFAILVGIITQKVLKKLDDKDKLQNSLLTSINDTKKFVNNIEQGNLNSQFKFDNGDKELRLSLESMRKSLLKGDEKERGRNKINLLVSEISNMLRSESNLDELGYNIISYLANNMDGVVQAAFYLVNNQQSDKKLITQIASHAYKRKKILQSEFQFGEGLVGQAAIEKDIILRTEIPEDYPTISSGLLGDKKPESILITPLSLEDEVYGVIELASLRKFNDLQINFLKELSEVIARTIHNIRVNEQTRLLFEESEKMRSELSIQKQQLIENAEKMIQTQDELKDTNSQLEIQIQETKVSTKKSMVLLENSLEVIFIFNPEGMTLFVSPSIKTVLGYFPEEVVGFRNVENLHPLDVERFEKFLDNIKSFPEKDHSLQYRYFTKSGEIIWLEAKGKNSLADEIIKGIVLNARDISEQRLAEKEQRIRAKMQALSENSLDLIIRIDIFSRCTYINPIIKEFTGLDNSSFIDKALMSVEIEESVLTFWKKMLDDVTTFNEKKTSEMVFPTKNGDRIMQVNAIPEFYENGDIESVLIICHDITEAKSREEIIGKNNKSIKDSINYALNIQSSLMPTEKMLQSIIPNSFLFYKPKDVVSGDYPWMYRDGDNVCIAAMDCTGHGVPGALMSIIGFFLQNQIIENNLSHNSGELLDNLHSGIVTTLKQGDEDSNLNDGMDAAFCKLDLKKMKLDYAGAHRPLYHVRDGILNEIKGDRFPVGSTQYRNRKNFTNHTIKIKPGDGFYFMTDGFPDQVGGSLRKKYMSGRVNMLIQDNAHLSIFQMGNLFRRTFDEWKGEAEQVDDVLIIGIKF